jgi:WD40 repeat protein
MIQLTCEECGSRLKAPEAAVGKKLKCPGCGTPVVVPVAAGGGAKAVPLPDADGPDEKDDGRPRRRRSRDGAVSTIIPYRNGKALAAYYCGIFGLVPGLGLVLGPAAVVLGFLGWRVVRARPEAKGTGHSITGVVLGALTTVVNAALVIFLAVGGGASYFHSGPDPSQEKVLQKALPPPGYGPGKSKWADKSGLFAEYRDAAEPNGIGRKWPYPADPGERAAIQAAGPLRAIALSADGSRLATVDAKDVNTWDIKLALCVSLRQHSGTTWRESCSAVALAPDGKQVALCSPTWPTLCLYGSATGTAPLPTLSWPSVTLPISTLAFVPDGKRLVGGGKEGLAFWDTATWQEQRSGWAGEVRALTFSKDGKTLAIISAGVHLLDAETLKEQMALPGAPAWAPRSAAFSPDDRVLAVVDSDGALQVWELSTGKLVFGDRQHNSSIDAVAYSPDGKNVVTGSHDGSLKLWDVTKRARVVATRKGNVKGDPVEHLTFTPDGRTLISGSGDVVKAWDVSQLRESKP